MKIVIPPETYLQMSEETYNEFVRALKEQYTEET